MVSGILEHIFITGHKDSVETARQGNELTGADDKGVEEYNIQCM